MYVFLCIYNKYRINLFKCSVYQCFINLVIANIYISLFYQKASPWVTLAFTPGNAMELNLQVYVIIMVGVIVSQATY